MCNTVEMEDKKCSLKFCRRSLQDGVQVLRNASVAGESIFLSRNISLWTILPRVVPRARALAYPGEEGKCFGLQNDDDERSTYGSNLKLIPATKNCLAFENKGGQIRVAGMAG